ncbi:hypothetical protein IGJ74_000830 [Enterococcus sp. AZ009]|uniref:hypothetical protein n=1 Tax=Enterococcus TaxID=1350 RepID=UPI001C4694B2|nr:hypothetical protein [Enterococcus casseliflavus]
MKKISKGIFCLGTSVLLLVNASPIDYPFSPLARGTVLRNYRRRNELLEAYSELKEG